MRFLVDMPLSPMLSQWLTHQGHDAIHASAICLDRAPDTDILAQAASDGRVVVTADLDYPRLLALSGAVGPAVILFRGSHWKEDQLVDRLSAAMRIIPQDELSRSLVVIEKSRIRRRVLPL